jgi:hypothetical protein
MICIYLKNNFEKSKGYVNLQLLPPPLILTCPQVTYFFKRYPLYLVEWTIPAKSCSSTEPLG